MTRKLYTVAIAAALLAGCETDPGTWRDNSSDAQKYSDINNNVNLSSVQSVDKKTALLTTEDRRFVADALADGMYEMQEGQHVASKTTDNELRNLAQHLVDDHSKANLQLQSFSEAKGVRIEPGLTTTQIGKLNALKGLMEPDMDREYLAQQQQAHRDGIKKFELASTAANDEGLRKLATEMLPTLRQHLEMINSQASLRGLPTEELRPGDIGGAMDK